MNFQFRTSAAGRRQFHTMRFPGVLVMLCALLLTSCAMSDPEYASLATIAESSPSKHAIVGMWHRRRNNLDYMWRMNMLIRIDGTGIVESFFNDSSFLGTGEQSSFDNLGDFTWSYNGQGVWSLKSTQYPNRVHQCRLSGGRLLRYSQAWADGGGGAYFVYDRVIP